MRRAKWSQRTYILSLWFTNGSGFECVIPLESIAVCDHNYSGKHFCNGWPEMEIFDKQFQEKIIEQDGPCH